MIVPRLIERKREGGALTPAEWRELVLRYAAGRVPDYQMASLLMAVFFQGMDARETRALTDAMMESGRVLNLAHLTVARVDKHSTGGVGDKVSLVLAPIIASLGVAVPMMSGRGLGHTGGTLDKLESIPGFRTRLSLEEITRQVERLGCALFGQSDDIAPADRKLYALRDATATVECVPLIAASIMSKKLSESLTGLVLDVKRGPGAFIAGETRGMPREVKVAEAMIELGADHGCPVVALMTAMDRPLGFACGNAIEVEEAIAALHGRGPADLMEVTYALGAEMLLLGETAESPDAAGAAMREVVASGRAAEKLAEIIEAQGGDPRVVEDPSLLPHGAQAATLEAPRAGFVAGVEPKTIGYGLVELGAGRRTMEDQIDPRVGFSITAKPGQRVEKGDLLATAYAGDDTKTERALAILRSAIAIADEAPKSLPLVSHRVTSAGVEELGWRPTEA